jgi:hypothetical protein
MNRFYSLLRQMTNSVVVENAIDEEVTRSDYHVMLVPLLDHLPCVTRS